MKPSEIKKIIKNFRKNLDLYKARYEGDLEYKFSSNPKLKESLIKKMQQNCTNFILYDHLFNKNYRKAIQLYSTEIYPSNIFLGNDITRIILLFFPFIIKSNEIYLTPEQSSLNHFNFENFSFKDCQNISLEKNIKDFFNNYKKLETTNFFFNRQELLRYMESFLYVYCQKAEEKIEKPKFRLDNFLLFLRPELYFTIKDNEELELL